MRESLAHAVGSGNLAMRDEVIRDVDRIAAMGRGCELGSMLLRLREGEQKQWGARCAYIIARRIQKRFRFTATISQSIAVCAILEWSKPHCHSCNGAREIQTDTLKIVCPACSGIGVHRWSNKDRRQMIGAYTAKIGDAVGFAHVAISEAVCEVVGVARKNLQYA